ILPCDFPDAVQQHKAKYEPRSGEAGVIAWEGQGQPSIP
ncbi:hypothetical protein RRG08_062862, partial [Elysia crispata]